MAKELSRTIRRHPGWFLRTYAFLFGVAALIGLVIGVVWVVAGILHFHPLW